MPQDRLPQPLLRARLCCAVMATILAVVIAEVTVRYLEIAPRVRQLNVSYANKDSVYTRSTNPILGYELKANYQNEFPDNVFTVRSTNSHGQRDIERTVDKPPGTSRLILLGDSVIENAAVRNLDDAISRQLEKLYADGRTEVLNFGVGGYCTLAEVELLRVKGLQFQPDVVVMVFVINDFENFNASAVQAIAAPEEQPSWFIKQLFHRSSLFRLGCVRLDLFQFGIRVDPAEWNRQAIGDNNVVDGLRQFAEMSRKHQFRAAIVIWPVFLDDDIVNDHFMPDSQELVIERLAGMHGIPTFRLSDYFKQHCESLNPPRNPKTYYSVGDTMHANEMGSRVAAQAIKQVVDNLSKHTESSEASRPSDERAADLSRKLGASGPEFNLARAMCLVAASHLQLGRVDEAVAHYEQALEIDPNSLVANEYLGVHLFHLGGLERAEKHLRRALAANPDRALSHHNLGFLLLEQSRLEAAAEQFHRTLQLEPEMAEAAFCLGRVRTEQGRLSEAERHYTQTLEIAPDFFEAHVGLGQLLMSQGRWTKARKHFSFALEADPQNEAARQGLAEIDVQSRARENGR